MSSGGVLRLSPNEEAAVLQKRQEEKRKARLLQVREQDRGLAHKVRQGVQRKRNLEKYVHETHLRAALAGAQQRKLDELEACYEARMGELGLGHRTADAEEQEEQRAGELRTILENKQKKRAHDRHLAAMRELNANELQQKTLKEQGLDKKRKAREMEDERAHKIAKRPPHLSGQPVIVDLVVSKGQRVQLKEADGYACTYYHIPHSIVQRDTGKRVRWKSEEDEEIGKDTAYHKAQWQSEADEQQKKLSATIKLEQDEKARMRHRHALAKLKLEKDKADMMSQLEVMEREDRSRRQKALSNMPSNLFQPVHQRLEMATEQQRDMEHAFEKLLVKTQSVDAPLLLGSDETTSSTEEEPGVHKYPPGSTGPIDDSAVYTAARMLAPSGSGTTEHTDDGHTPRPHPSQGISSSLSPEDQIPANIPRPFPASPPQRPLRAWGSRDQDDTPSLTDTPLSHSPARDYGVGMDGDSASKATQTQRPHFRPKVLTRVLSQPDLSMSDSASTLSKGASLAASSSSLSRDLGAKVTVQSTGGESGVTGESDQHSKSHGQHPPNEGIQKLMSLVQEQQRAWRERLATRPGLGQVGRTTVGGTVGADRAEGEGEREEEGLRSTAHESLSISTLSTKDSSLCVGEGGGVFSSRSATHSPAPLSISQYHTTLEASAFSSPGQPHQQSPGTAAPPTSQLGYPLPDPSRAPPQTSATEVSTSQTLGTVSTTTGVSASTNQGSRDGPSSRPLNFHRASVDYAALDARRELSMSTLTAMDCYVPVDIALDSSEDLVAPTSTQVDVVSGTSSQPALYSAPSPALRSLQSAMEGTVAHLAQPSLDVASSLTDTNTYTQGDSLSGPGEGGQSQGTQSLGAHWGVQRSPGNTHVDSLQGPGEGGQSQGTHLDPLLSSGNSHVDSLQGPGEGQGTFVDSQFPPGLREGQDSQLLPATGGEQGHLQRATDQQHYTFHRTRVDYTALESRPDLSMSTTTAMDYSMYTSVHDDSTLSPVHESVGPVNSLLQSAVPGTVRHLQQPSLDVTSSSLLSAAQSTAGGTAPPTVSLAALSSTVGHLQQPSLDVTSSSLLSTSQPNAGGTAPPTIPVSALSSSVGHLQQPSLDVTSSSLLSAPSTRAGDTQAPPVLRETDMQIPQVTSGPLLHPLHAFQRSELTQPNISFSHLVTPTSHDPHTESHPSHLITPEPHPPDDQPRPVYLWSPHTPQFIPLSEASFLPAASPSPSAYTPLKPATSSPLVQTSAPAGVNFSHQLSTGPPLFSPGLEPDDTAHHVSLDVGDILIDTRVPYMQHYGHAYTPPPHDHTPSRLSPHPQDHAPLHYRSPHPHGHTPLQSGSLHPHGHTPLQSGSPHTHGHTPLQSGSPHPHSHTPFQSGSPHPHGHTPSRSRSPSPQLYSSTYTLLPCDHTPASPHPHAPPPRPPSPHPHDHTPPPRPPSPLHYSPTFHTPPQSPGPLSSHPRVPHTTGQLTSGFVSAGLVDTVLTQGPVSLDTRQPLLFTTSAQLQPSPQGPVPVDLEQPLFATSSQPFTHTRQSPQSHSPHPPGPYPQETGIRMSPQPAQQGAGIYVPIRRHSPSPRPPSPSQQETGIRMSPQPALIHPRHAHHHSPSPHPPSPHLQETGPPQYPPPTSSYQPETGTRLPQRYSPPPAPPTRSYQPGTGIYIPTALQDSEGTTPVNSSSLQHTPTHLLASAGVGETGGLGEGHLQPTSGMDLPYNSQQTSPYHLEPASGEDVLSYHPQPDSAYDYQPTLGDQPYHSQPASYDLQPASRNDSVDGDHSGDSTMPTSSDSSELSPPQQTHLSPGNGHQTQPQSGLTLQQAFIQRKIDFVQQSQHRLQNLKQNAERREQAILAQAGGGRGGVALRTVQPIGRPRLPSAHVAARVGGAEQHKSSIGGPLLGDQLFSSARQKEKIKKAEMRERNLRLYSRLPEVKRKMEETKRQREYAENREKAKVYQQRLQTKMRSQTRGQSKSVPSLPADTSRPQPAGHASQPRSSGHASQPRSVKWSSPITTSTANRDIKGAHSSRQASESKLSSRQTESSRSKVRNSNGRDEAKKTRPPFR